MKKKYICMLIAFLCFVTLGGCDSVQKAESIPLDMPTGTMEPMPTSIPETVSKDTTDPTATSAPVATPTLEPTVTPEPTPTPTNTPTPKIDPATYTTDIFKWKHKTDGTVIIVGLTKSVKEAVVIPSEIEEMAVSEIEARAFANNGMTSVVISENVEKIGSSAFYKCDNLVSVTLPSTLKELGEDVFYSCEKLKKFIMEDNDIFYVKEDILFNKPEKKLVKVPDALKLSSYTVPEGIEIIGNSAFDYCDSITEVILPDTVTTLENDAFARCAGMESIYLPESIVYIGEMAFWSCISVEKFELPSSVMYIGEKAFSGCRGLREIEIKNNDIYYTTEGVLFDGSTKTLMCMPGKSHIKHYKVPVGIEHISEWAFSQCNNLVSIELPDGLLSIRTAAFLGLGFELKSAIIPASVTEIGERAFLGCDKLTIYTPSGSFAEQYAAKNSIRVQISAPNS